MTTAEWATTVAGAIGALTGAASAGFWWASAKVPTPEPLAYMSHVPEHVAKALDKIGFRNRWAAILAGVAVGCQAIVLAVPAIWPTPKCDPQSCVVRDQAR